MKNNKLLILISVVTLLLQLISFATTWSGSKIYLEGVFPFASLLFAVAIQSTAYFLSNSLRTRVSLLKVTALFAAICCSTYYSYIGIYNSVNSPDRYLQKNYARISSELNGIFRTELQDNLSDAADAVGEAASLVTARISSLSQTRESILACRDALSGIESTYAEKMRAPKQSAYENYEDYAAAYNAYINSLSASSSTEDLAARNQVLASYGFSDPQDLALAESENAAAFSAICTALGITAEEDPAAFTATLQASVLTTLDNAASGIAPDASATARLYSLMQAANLCGYKGMETSDLLNTLRVCSDVSSDALLADYASLTLSLSGGRVTAANTMELKSSIDSQILSALLTINTLLPEQEQISLSDSRFLITDLYLIPVFALHDPASRTTAFFCLAVAGLIDGLSVLFAISLRRRKSLYGRHILLGTGFQDYAAQIFASLPQDKTSAASLTEFLSLFVPSPETEGAGYMMSADMTALNAYLPLAALLCQLNLAKILPSGTMLLKARFVFWANGIIYENNFNQKEVYA